MVLACLVGLGLQVALSLLDSKDMLAAVARGGRTRLGDSLRDERGGVKAGRRVDWEQQRAATASRRRTRSRKLGSRARPHASSARDPPLPFPVRCPPTSRFLARSLCLPVLALCARSVADPRPSCSSALGAQKYSRHEAATVNVERRRRHLTAPGPRSSFEATACVGDGHARTDTLQCSVIISSLGCHRRPRRTIRPPELADISLIFFSTPLYIYLRPSPSLLSSRPV